MVAPKLLGIGNRYRGDDGAGLEVIAQLAGKLPESMLSTGDGELTGILDYFEAHSELLLIDAIEVPSGTLEAGSLVWINPLDEPLSDTALRSSSHAIGLAEAIELARSLGRLPASLRIVGIVGEDFSRVEGLTRPVRAAVDRLVRQLAEEFLQFEGQR